jgi:asparagine synthase (glutamine-hydrolysing)
MDVIKLAPKALWYIEMPRTVGFFLYSLTKLSRKKKYVFFGEGAEEVFFGRDDHPILRKLGVLRRIVPQPLRHASKFLDIIPNKNFQKIITGFSSDIFEFYAKYRNRFTQMESKFLFSPDILNSDIAKRIRLSFDKKESKDFLRNFAYLDLDIWLFSQPYFCVCQDVANHFMDHDLLKFAFSIPSQIKVKNNTPRYLEKKVMNGKIPDEIIRRGWQAWDAQENWVGEQKDVITYFIEKLKERKILNKNIGPLANFVEKNAFYPNDHKLWNLFTLEIFCEVFLDRDKIKEPPKLNI